ncbi:FtsK/SpoIIIE domain-containing protein [Micromonospora sp. WMMD1102]|uniref:FtsK/SpoIIIE domain-containing protein n=1 Tax=Micromonospora sp. WMMD1102 TaxID=3016105 RepID=UPI002414FC50|nr:FtsK/SpoIIIE domain-containing protein [Micromonospora sp. WMMD1102]MDG4788085.1 FtsK/SpoIIIE domain-containing protein [Micromonospora sp. WMMD1102]
MAAEIQPGDDLEPTVPAPRAGTPEYVEPRGEQVALEPGRADGPPVDPPMRKATFADITSRYQPKDRKPIVPATLRTAAGRHALAQWVIAFVTYTIGYYGLRSPKYAVKAACYAPRGALRLTGRALRWAFDLEGFAIRQDAASRNNVADYLALSRQRDRRVSSRMWVFLPGLVLLAVAVAALVWFAPPLVQLGTAVTALPVLAYFGRAVGEPFFERAWTGERFIRLTAILTRQAILACNIKGVKEPGDIKFVRDIFRADAGHEALITLPPGVLATDVIDQRDRLASGFRLPKQQVWPATIPGEHPGMLSIWVADRPVNQMTPPPWPLLDGGTFDYFTDTFVYGYDERMRPVSYPLEQKNSLFGGIPGSGKTKSVLVLPLAAIHDPLVLLLAFDLKGSGDLDVLEPLCLKGLYGSGGDEATKEAALAALEWLYRQCDERAALVRQYARQGLNTENRVNRRMAEKDARLRPLLGIFDELQELLTDPDLGKRAKFLLTSIIKRGRALAMHIVFATQRIDSQSVPPGISSNFAIRNCLAVPSHTETNLVLGTGAYARGARPTEFEPGDSTGPKDSGWAYQAGNGPTRAVRSCYIDNPTAAAIVARVIEARRGGQVEEVEVPKYEMRNLLADVRQVWHEGEEALWSELIVPRLKQLDPEAYADLDVDTFGRLMSAAGVPTESLNRRIDSSSTKRATRAGVKLAALEARITARNAETITETNLAEIDD